MNIQQAGTTEVPGDIPTSKVTKTDQQEVFTNSERGDFHTEQGVSTITTQFYRKMSPTSQFVGNMKNQEQKEATEPENFPSKLPLDSDQHPESTEKREPDAQGMTKGQGISLLNDSNEKSLSDLVKKKSIPLGDLRTSTVKRNHEGLATPSNLKIPISEGGIFLSPEIRNNNSMLEGTPTSYKPGFQRFSVINMVRTGGGLMLNQDLTPSNFMTPKENERSGNCSFATPRGENDTMFLFSQVATKASRFQTGIRADESTISAPTSDTTTKSRKNSCKSVLKRMAYLLGFLVIFGVISVGFSFLANNYENDEYEGWGRGLILGFMFALVDAALMMSIIKEYRLHSKMTQDYSSIYVIVVLSLIISSVLCAGIILGIRKGLGPTHYNQVLALLVVTVVNGILYYLYLSCMERLCKEKTEKKERAQGFFTTHIYKDFMMEIHEIGTKIKANKESTPKINVQNQKNQKRQGQKKGSSKEKTPDGSPNDPSTLFDGFRKTASLIDAKNSYGVHLFLLMALGHLAACYGFVHLIQYADEEELHQGIYVIVLAYPFVSGIIGKIVSKIIKRLNILLTPTSIQLVALAFAAFPWRIIFLNMEGYQGILITLICKTAYKIAAYVIFPCVFLARLQKDESIGHQLSKRWTKFKRTLTKRLQRRAERKTTGSIIAGISIFEMATLNKDEDQQRIAEAHIFALRFATLELVDFMSIISFSVYVVIFKYLNPGTFLVDLASPNEDWTGVGRVLIYNAIDLGTEVLVILATVLTWYKSSKYRETKPWKEIRTCLSDSRVLLLLAATFVFFSTSINIPGYFL